MSVALASLLLTASAAMLQAQSSNDDWHTVFEEDLTRADLSFGWVGTNWLVRNGHWQATPQGLRKRGKDDEGVLMLRLPVAYGAVRVEYEAMSDAATPGDLSLLIGLAPDDIERFTRASAFFGFGTRGNTGSRLAVPGLTPVSGSAHIVPNHWHRVVVERAHGLVSAFVDGHPVASAPDAIGGYAGPFIALYAWGEGVFRSIRVSTKPDPQLESFLLPPARATFSTPVPGPRLSIRNLARPPLVHEQPPYTLYVSPQGRDTWSGDRDAPTADQTDGPLASLQAALDHIQTITRNYDGLPGPVQILLRGGRYPLSAPVTITPAQGGFRTDFHWMETDPAFAVTIKACPGEIPVLSGGRRITGFQPTTINGRDAWAADLPEVRAGTWNFHQLWINGERRLRPRLPRADTFFKVAAHADGRQFSGPNWNWEGKDHQFRFNPGDLSAAWQNLQDVEIVLFNYWIDSRMWIHAIEAGINRVTLDRLIHASIIDDRTGTGATYWVENVREALTEPGEWYLDRHEGRLYILPRLGDRLDTAEVIAPLLSQLIRLEGTSPDTPVTEVHLDGLTFAHTEWNFPTNRSASSQAANEVPGAIFATNALLCSIKNCRVEHLGGYGIELTGASRDITIARNVITDLGAGGIKVWHGTKRTKITDNVISHGGRVFHAGVGILVGNSGGNQLLHNAVFDFDYSAVSIGWTWGYHDSPCMGNIVEYNHLYDIGHGRLSDMGGIYTLGPQPGTRLRYNYIHDVTSRSYGGYGIYMDEGSSDILIENNLCVRCQTGGFNQHYGRDNIVQNNIFAYAATNDLERAREEIHPSFIFAHNIVLSQTGIIWPRTWTTNSSPVFSNLYWRTTPGDLVFTGDNTNFAAWQARGLDHGTVIADPLFQSPESNNFTLPKYSPALKVGFVPFDLSTAGPRDKD